MEKFNTCIYRSEKEEDLTEESCCGKKARKKRGYICMHLGIEDVKPEQCEKCDFYKNKEKIEEGKPFG